MEEPDSPMQHSEPEPRSAQLKNLERKAALLLAFTVALVACSVLYLLYARGAFEPKQTLVLLTDNAEGVVVGMDMTFSGFPIGNVRRVELAESGQVRIVIDVPTKDAHWLRTSSVFTIVRGLVGGTGIRAFSGVLTDPQLPDGAQVPVLRGDSTAELQRVLTTAREVLENVNAITAQEGALGATLANLRELSDKLKGPRGLAGVALGSDADAQKLITTIERANALLARMDSIAAKADTQVFGPDGMMKDARASVQQLNQLLGEARESLKRVDAVLVEAQGIGANVRGATTDLGKLRAEVEANLQRIEGMINELNRKWPFARETEVKLP